jgi:hypothetical protein
MGLTADNYEAHRKAMEHVLQYSAEAKEGQDKLNAKGVTVIVSTLTSPSCRNNSLECSGYSLAGLS